MRSRSRGGSPAPERWSLCSPPGTRMRRRTTGRTVTSSCGKAAASACTGQQHATCGGTGSSTMRSSTSRTGSRSSRRSGFPGQYGRHLRGAPRAPGPVRHVLPLAAEPRGAFAGGQGNPSRVPRPSVRRGLSLDPRRDAPPAWSSRAGAHRSQRDRPLPRSRPPRSPDPTIAVVTRLVPHKQLHLLVRGGARPAAPLAGPAGGHRRHRAGRRQLAGTGSRARPGTGRDACPAGCSEQAKGDLLSRAWLTVAPSLAEGWGLTVLEANCARNSRGGLRRPRAA